MTTLQEAAMRKALEALEHIQRCIGFATATIHQGSATWCQSEDAIASIKAALARHGEPVAYIDKRGRLLSYKDKPIPVDTLVYEAAARALPAEELTDRLVAISSAVADSDDRKAQAMLSETLQLLAAAPAPLAQQGEQQPVCHGCGIPVGDVHMSTCKSGKWPSRVSNGDTAAPAPQPT